MLLVTARFRERPTHAHSSTVWKILCVLFIFRDITDSEQLMICRLCILTSIEKENTEIPIEKDTVALDLCGAQTP